MSNVYVLNESLLLKEDTPSKTFTLLIKDSSGNSVSLEGTAVKVKLYSGSSFEKIYTASIVSATDGKVSFTAIREDLKLYGLYEMVVIVSETVYPSGDSLLFRVEGVKETVNINDKQNQGSESGTNDGNYLTLTNKPKINGVILSGNKTSSDLRLANSTHSHDMADSGLSETSAEDIENYWNTLYKG